MKEQVFTTKNIIGYSADNGDVVDTTLHELMAMLKLLPKNVTDSLCVSYTQEFDGIHIHEISNLLTDEIYWQKNDLPENRMWTDSDEILVENLLMWGELA